MIGIITLPLFAPQGFSQCIYNDDWPDAPCFDMGPVSHQKFYDAWAPYYEHKGEDWMEAKKVEMNQALENQSFEEWVEKLENYNVYRYYLSRNEIQSNLPYDGLFVRLDPNFTPRTSIPDENNKRLCLGSPFMILNDQCQRIGNYDPQTGIPIVNNKEECDKLDGTWYDDRKLCDSKYAPVEYRFQFEPEPEPEPYILSDNLCPPDKVFDWDICVDQCPSGQIASNGVCQPVASDIVSIFANKVFLVFFITLSAIVSISIGFIIWRKRK